VSRKAVSRKSEALFPLEDFSSASSKAKPFLKWAGGKTQLLDDIRSRIPLGLRGGTITRYVEPFIGGGAVFFDLSHSITFETSLLQDVNHDLILTYSCIQQDVHNLIDLLLTMEQHYNALSLGEQCEYFYHIRQKFNEGRSAIDYDSHNGDRVQRAAQILFLNKTCFNGLFRVNSKGHFNVPFGKYKNPTICNAANLERVSGVLGKAEIKLGDFESCEQYVDCQTFVYFDPPYRPLNRTASFTSYAASTFDEKEQLRLAAFFRRLDSKGAKVMLSNSDPKNEDPQDDFFDDAYSGFRIERVRATRMINCDATKRGQINELIITNY